MRSVKFIPVISPDTYEDTAPSKLIQYFSTVRFISANKAHIGTKPNLIIFRQFNWPMDVGRISISGPLNAFGPQL